MMLPNFSNLDWNTPMKKSTMNRTVSALVCGAFALVAGSAGAAPLTTNLYAKLVYYHPTTGARISPSAATPPAPSSGYIPVWGFATTPNGQAQIPGPKLDVAPDQHDGANEGVVITVYNLLTNLPYSEPISLVIPGLNGTTNVGQPVKFGAGDADYPNRVRSLVPEVPVGGSRVYAWTGPLKLGTYAYHSGTHPSLQVQMGLYGMLTVRSNNNQAYKGYSIPTNRETPVVFSELDPILHWAVTTNGYGPGKAISSTIHSDPSFFLINGRAYSKSTTPPDLTAGGALSQTTLFRMVNFCWDSRIPTLAGPVPIGRSVPQGSGANYVTAIAEDAHLYPFPRTAYAPNLAALKTLDVLFTPPTPGGSGPPHYYFFYDHRLGLSSPGNPDGGMYARWVVTAN